MNVVRRDQHPAAPHRFVDEQTLAGTGKRDRAGADMSGQDMRRTKPDQHQHHQPEQPEQGAGLFDMDQHVGLMREPRDDDQRAGGDRLREQGEGPDRGDFAEQATRLFILIATFVGGCIRLQRR